MESFLQIDNLTKAFGDLVLFEDFSINVSEGERVGIIARNGYGKSTLMNVITGKEDIQKGSVTFRNDIKTAYLVQSPAYPAGTRVLEACFTGDSPILGIISEYETSMEKGDQNRIQKAMAEMDAHDAWNYESRAKQILTQLEITEFEKPIEQLSGGQVKRVALANALINEPDFLILDEPTNHLDVSVTQWLEDYLSAGKITLLLVTHDRYLLDRVCTRIIEIDDRKAYSYAGNYSYYLEKRQERIDARQAQNERGLNLYRHELDWMRRMPCARGTKARFRKESFYELEERLKNRREEGSIQLDVKASYIGKKIFEIEHLNKKFDSKIILRDFSYVFTKYEKIGIVGENGVGKSTFIKMLLGLVEPDSGSIERGTTLSIGYYSQEGLQFNENAKVIDVITDIADHVELDDGRKMSASQFLQKFLFTPQTQYKYVGRLSGGEKRRLYLCSILMQSPNFLILDEPTNDLDIMTLQVLEEYISSFQGCVIVISHDRYFMDRIARHLFVFEGDGIVTDFPSSYSDYINWKELKADAEKMLAEELSHKQSVRQSAPSNEKPAIKGDYSKRLSFKEKREIELIETEMQELEAEQKELEAMMNSGTLPFNELDTKAKRVSAIISRIDEITLRWMELSEKS